MLVSSGLEPVWYIHVDCAVDWLKTQPVQLVTLKAGYFSCIQLLQGITAKQKIDGDMNYLFSLRMSCNRILGKVT